MAEPMLWFLLLAFAVAAGVGGQQTGFINIDCGIPANTSYLDEINGLRYVSDDQFVDAGVNYDVSPVYTLNLARRYLTVRSFPEGARNCYTFKSMTPGLKYLARAVFLYGNYDSKNSAWVQFDLYLGVNRWKTVNLTDPRPGSYFFTEVVSEATADVMTVCLVNTGHGTPFISGLDLRQMPASHYPLANASRSLVLQYRINMGGDADIRYPYDRFDRLWFRSAQNTKRNVTSTNSTIQNRANDQYEPPLIIMQTAVFPVNSTKLEFVLTADPGDLDEFCAVMYFSELQPNISRQFFIYINGALLNDAKPFTPSYLFTDVVVNTSPSVGYSDCNVSIVAAQSSTLPPILNAFELFTTMPQTNLASDSRDVDAMLAVKESYWVKKNWMGDPCSPKDYAWDGLNCTFNNSGSPRITAVNLSYSGLIGEMTTSFANMSAIQYLDLSHNNLTGSIPVALAYLPSIKLLDLTDNQLTGSVPSALLARFQNGSIILRIGGNPNICESSCERSQASQSKKNSALIIVIASVVPVIVLVAAVIILCMLRRRKTGRSVIEKPQVEDKYQLENRKFTYKELETITNNFGRTIGRGGFATVYHGLLEDDIEVAVKMLSQPSSKGTKEFIAEAQHLTRVHHKNLVSMIGYCMDGDHLALVCEFMSQGTLKEHIKATGWLISCNLTGGHAPLSWERRLKIALDAAQGLEYLHTGCKPPLIHRDVKTTNILLNEGLEAKISDFGLSRAFQNDSNTHTSTRVVGTMGYLDPEYYIKNQLSHKSDVYSFGVVLLEIITGKSVLVNDPEDIHIVEWVRQRLARGNIEDVIDTSLAEERVVNSAWKMANVALACTTHASNRRPTMMEVVMQLKESLALYSGEDKAQFQNTSSEKMFIGSNDISHISALEMEYGSISDNEGPSAR